MTLLSVCIPTHRRPDAVAAAVASVLAQDLPAGSEMEVVVGVAEGEDRETLMALAPQLEGGLVRVVHAKVAGPGPLRNAALLAARGELVALLDDDCVAQPGWAAAGIAALGMAHPGAGADLVQGRTIPAGPWTGLEHSIRVERMSWLWEACNLFIRASAIEAAGLFDEGWDYPAGGTKTWGEDIEWGWRLVRTGARPAFAAGALAVHPVVERDRRDWAAHKLRLSLFPRLLRQVPEARRHLQAGVFVSPRHRQVTAALLFELAGVLVGRAGARSGGRLLQAAGAAVYLAPVLREPASLPRALPWLLATDALEMGAALYGSLRWRRVVI